jgi:hypothetical protein
MELTATKVAASFAIKEEDFYAKVWANKNF